MWPYRKLRRWWNEQSQLAKAEKEIERLRASYDPKIRAVRRPPWDEYQKLVGELLHELEFPEGEIEKIRTDRRLRDAQRYEVIIPKRPKDMEDNEHWDFSHTEGHILSQNGHLLLRHEIAREREIRERPLISWMAVAISLASLAISSLNTLFG